MKNQISNLALFIGLLGGSAAAWAIPACNALPGGEIVVFGSATFDRSVANQLTVKQTSTKLISNWDSFSIGSAATVNFIQPTFSSRALNRVVSTSPTEIFGKLNANGQVFLVNSAGIAFGKGSQVQTGALLASVLGITDRNFIANELNFERGTTIRQISNQGTLLAKEGNVTLLGPTLQNSGSIESSKGNIFFANGNQLGVFDHNIALLQASSVTSLIRNTGTLTATRLETRKGQVMLLGEQSNSKGKMELSGTINSQNAWVRANQLYINGALSSTGNTALESTRSIYINAPLTVSRDGALLSIVHGTSYGNEFKLGKGVRVSLTGINPYFRVNGNFYKIIKKASDLKAISTSSGSRAGKYALVADIDVSETAAWDNGKGFMPIDVFSGTINGLGHSISGLNINRPTMDNVGLFGSTDYNADIENLNLSHVVIHGANFVGAMVGINKGTIYQTNVQGSVSGGNNTGGLVGINWADIERANAQVSVSGGDNTGGLVGLNKDYYAHISNTSSSGDVSGHDAVGGLVGSQFADENGYVNIINSYATGNVSGHSDIGGLVGVNSTAGGTAEIENSYATGNVSGTAAVGGLVGFNSAYTTHDYEEYYDGIVFYYDYPGTASINRSYSTGKVTGSTKGGLVGLQDADSDSYAGAVDSYWNKDSAQVTSSATGSALNNTTLKQIASFKNWDISNLPTGSSSIWYINEGVSAPQLR